MGAVRTYYSLVPQRLDQAWNMLGPSLQAQGKDRYERFWHSIDNVVIIGDPVQVGSNVVVTVQFAKGGNKITERHVLGMVTGPDGQPLINTDHRG